ncbi:MAG: hypothetical protein NZM07_10205 [Elioraea sp.]|nr:hypothetical protein [Elioraea sp.]
MQPRSRIVTAASRQPATPAPAVKSDRSWMQSGAAGRALSEQELARIREEQERRRLLGQMPFRYWLRPGEQGDVIVLDASLEDACFIYEHVLKNPKTGKWDVYEPCPREWEICPLCQAYGESTYTLFLSVLDLRPYQRRDGTVKEYSRKLLAVKPQQHGMFFRLADRHGRLRGIHLLMSRDSDKAPRIGVPEFVAIYDEATLTENFGHPAELDPTGKIVKPQNADLQPFDYGLLFRKPSAEDLRKRYGLPGPAGSREEIRQAWSTPGATVAPAPVAEGEVATETRKIVRRVTNAQPVREQDEDEAPVDVPSEQLDDAPF